MCYCNTKFPSIYCVVCGELYCVMCISKSNMLKCDSCDSYYCNSCGIEVECSHNFCSKKCMLDNSKKKCDDICFTLREMYKE